METNDSYIRRIFFVFEGFKKVKLYYRLKQTILDEPKGQTNYRLIK